MDRKTARIIITFDCLRNCSYCCNKYTKIINTAKKLDTFLDLIDFEEICITGGEPTLYIDKTIEFIDKLRMVFPNKIIYMYTALYKPELENLIPLLDGIHYTLHENLVEEDITNFYKFQELIKKFNKSFRLYIHQNVKFPVTIIPKLWKRIEMKKWLNENECELPKNEVLFKLDNLN